MPDQSTRPDVAALVDAIDFWVCLWEEAAEFSRTRIQEDLRERRNLHADPESELRELIPIIATITSDECQESVLATLWAGKQAIAELEERYESGYETRAEDH